MAIKQTIQNYVTFFTALSPLFISTFLLLNSFLNGDLRGMIFLVGNALASGIGTLTKKSLMTKAFRRGPAKKGEEYNPATDGPAHDYCDVFEPLDSSTKYYTMPSSHMVFFGYLITYLSLGIAENPNEPKPGLPFIISVSSFALLDLIFRIRSRCDGVADVVGGLVIGGLVGLGWYMLIRYLWPNGDGGKMVYFAKEDLDVAKCKLGKTQFKCRKK